MNDEFLDTNIILYLLDTGRKTDIATDLLKRRPVMSVQVLNEAYVNCRRKAHMSSQEAGTFLAGVRYFCTVHPLTVETHDIGRALEERYKFSVYDAMIVAAAMQAGCTTLFSEDMQHGLSVHDQLTILNPFQ